MQLIFLSACVCVIIFTMEVTCASFFKRKLAEKRNILLDFNNNKKLGAEVFTIPRALKVGDSISIAGLMRTDRESVTVNLVKEDLEGNPDYNNVVCQVRLDFPSGGNSKDTIYINSIVDGKLEENDEDLPASGVFLSENFTIVFKMRDLRIEVDLHATPTINECAINRFEDIKFLTLGGDVEKVEALNFAFS